MVSPFLPDAEKVAAVREALPATAAGIYLNTGSVGPLPVETARAMAEQAEWDLRTGRAHEDYLPETMLRMDEGRAAVAAVLGTDPSRIALTHAATEGMAAAAWGIDWRPGDAIVTTSLEHAGGLAAVWTASRRLGLRLVVADVGDGGDDERTLAAIEQACAAAGGDVRLVATSHVSWLTGAVLPIARLAELAHERGALLAVDGAQAAGAIPVAVEEAGADLYAVAGQKWLLGPEGTGALYVARAADAAVAPTFAGWWSFASLDPGTAAGEPWPDARRFEVSGFPRASIVGLARSCGWLSMYVGLPWVHERTARLARLAAALLADVPGVSVLTPRAAMAGLVAFRVAGWQAERVAEELSRRVFAILRTVPPLDAVRISVGFFNTEAELERLRDGVAELAAHTPATLPPRRSLTILHGEPP
ncbi:MAG TPA: aminotransferase class V-fold PLP-dependent enzyme [Candidatus Limnocylindrales bacterium]